MLRSIGECAPGMATYVLDLVEEFIAHNFDVCNFAFARNDEYFVDSEKNLTEWVKEEEGQWGITSQISQGDDEIIISMSDVYAEASATLIPRYIYDYGKGTRELYMYELEIEGETTSGHRYGIYTELDTSGHQTRSWRLRENKCDFGGQSFWGHWLLDGEFGALEDSAWAAVRSFLTRSWLDGELGDAEYLAQLRLTTPTEG